MDQDDLHKLTAAILTLSQGLDAVHELMRKELSFNVDIHGTKIHERFIPKKTSQRKRSKAISRLS